MKRTAVLLGSKPANTELKYLQLNTSAYCSNTAAILKQLQLLVLLRIIKYWNLVTYFEVGHREMALSALFNV